MVTELGSYKQAHTRSRLLLHATPEQRESSLSQGVGIKSTDCAWRWARQASPPPCPSSEMTFQVPMARATIRWLRQRGPRPPPKSSFETSGGEPLGRWAHVARLVCEQKPSHQTFCLCQIVHEAHPKLRSVLGVHDSQYPYITSIKTAQLSYYKIISKTQNERLYSWEQSWSWLCVSPTWYLSLL